MPNRLRHDPFQIELPEGWEDQTVFTFQGPPVGENPLLLTLFVDRHAGDIDLESYAEDRKEMFLANMQGIEVLKDEPKTLESGYQAHELVIRWIPFHDRVIFKKQVYLVMNGVGYVFSVDFSKNSYKTVGLEVDKIISSLMPAQKA